jgi:predicted RNA binding protein YcfA (HicA-like mRNA interferase family)
MPKLPCLSGRAAIRVFAKLGFTIARQRGSHVVLRRAGNGCVIPLHRELAHGTLRNAIHQANLSEQQFLSAWRDV